MTSIETNIQIIQIKKLPAEFSVLIDESVLEGYNFVKKTLNEWSLGKNQFDKPGECFYLAYIKDQIVGCCGLNLDPYTEINDVGRIRHLYVSQKFRRRGIAKELTNISLKNATSHFKVVRLRANQKTVDSFKFYESMGFKKSDSDSFETHRIIIHD